MAQQVVQLPLLPDMNLDTGIKPYESFDQAKENVNIDSGNLNVQIPLIHLPGRNGHDFTVMLTYNSQNWTPRATPYVNGNISSPSPDAITIGWQYPQGNAISVGSTGWQFNTPVLYAAGTTIPPACASTSSGCAYLSSVTQTSYWSNFYLVMGDGRKYQFPFASVCNLSSTTTYAAGLVTNISTVGVPGPEVLIGWDSTTQYGAHGGEGVMLDLTNVASGSGTGTAVVRFRDGSQLLFNLNLSSCSTGNFVGATANGLNWFVASALVDSNGNVISFPQGSTGEGSTGVGYSYSQYKNSNGQPENITLYYSPQFPTDSADAPTFQTPAVNESQGIYPGGGTSYIGFMLSAIMLPDGLTYTFQYNQYGELTEITYPSGGYTRYKYAANPNILWYHFTSEITTQADSRVVIEKDTCPGQAVAAGALTPSGYAGTSTPASTCPVAEQKTTYNGGAVIDPLGNETDYGFFTDNCAYVPPTTPGPFFSYSWGSGGMEVARNVYQGSGSSKTFLRGVYSLYQSGCQPLKTGEMTILPNGTWSWTTWSYDTTVHPISGPTVWDQGYQVTSGGNFETDNMTMKTEYAFGAGPPPATFPTTPSLPLLRTTGNSYLSGDLSTNPVNGVDYELYPIYILNRLQTQIVYNASGTAIAQTNYTYDSYPGGIATSNAVQHGTALQSYNSSYTTRGNVTQVSRWVANGASAVSTSYQYDDAGNVLVKTDPAGNQTQYSFADSWGSPAGSTCAPTSGATAAFPTTITTAAGEKTTYTWNSCTGTMASATDTNIQTTSLTYDCMDRRVQANYPDGGQTSLSYSDAPSWTCSSSAEPLPITIAMTKKMNGNENDVSTTILDGLSRVVETQHNSDPWGVDYVNTTYDAAGNVASVTNPFRLAGESSDGTVQYQYDALHRKVIQIQQDGSALQWCYDDIKVNSLQSSSLCSSNLGNQSQLGTWTDIMDETGRHWQDTSDALGHLVKVLEPNPANSITAAPADETDYTYDALDDLTQVSQWNGSYETTPGLARSFIYDGIARLTSSTNPETGTTTYNYLNSGGGFCSGVPANLCIRTDANGAATTYSYDADNNLTGRTYSDGTPAATFVYQHGYGSSSNNANGRLIQEYTGSSSSSLASTANIAYDQMGRNVQEQQCVFGNCTTSPPTWSSSESGCTGSAFSPSGTQLMRAYDCAGDLTSWTTGQPILGTNNPITLSAMYDPAGRLGEITSSWSDAYHPNTPFWAGYNGSASEVNSTAPYGPAGLNAAELSYTSTSGSGAILLARNYDKRFRVLNENDTSNATDAATATVTISGSEQSATTSYGSGSTDSTGSVTIGGSEQSKSSATGTGSAPGTGSITISGSEEVAYVSTGEGNYPVYDTGYFSVTINGSGVASYTYGEGSTAAYIASSLASQIAANSTVVTASASGGTISLTSKTNGASTDYSLSVSFSWGSNSNLFSSPSFSASTSGSALAGGKNGAIYDSGSVTVTVNGHSDSASYGQGSTPSTIASALASAISGDSAASVTATASGATVSLQSKQTGASANWPIGTSVAYSTSNFSSASFSAASSGMSGGQNGTTYDSGTVSITVSGHTDTVSFGQGSTAAGIASALDSTINGDSSAAVKATVNGATLTLNTKATGPGADDSLSVSDTYNSAVFAQSSFTALPSGSSLTGGSTAGTVLYSYNLGYDLNSNVLSVQDSVTGTWSYQYDSLNRLIYGSTSSGHYSGTNNGTLNVNWGIDLFGNDKGETFSGSSNVSLTQPELLTFTAHGTGNNNRADQFTYDNDGRTLQDNLNKYAYDAEGRLCAEQAISGGAVTLYLYDAEGTRVAKGGGSACVTASTTQSSFSPEKWFILDTAGQQMTEMDYGGGAWQWGHTNIFAGGKLLATYSDTGTACCNTTTPTTFALSDWLGTKRVQATATGAIDGNGADTFASLPYGDEEFNGTGATEHFFTGKERDTESGNDYFDARYYASSMGRFLSPDWSTRRTPGSTLPLDPADDKWPVPYAKLDNPQSLNLYGYVLNNPLGKADADGHDFVILNESSAAEGEGHNAALVGNDKDGWTYFSANGYGANPGVSMDTFKTFSDFQKSGDATRYDNGYRVQTTSTQDAAMKDTGGKQINAPYSITAEKNADGTNKSQNCADLTAAIGKSGGVNIGTPQKTDTVTVAGHTVASKTFTSPNEQYSGVKQNNQGTTVKPCTGNNCQH